MPMIGEEGESIVVPDVAEAIVAYRAWRANVWEDSDYPKNALRSQGGAHGIWERGPNRCECNNGNWKGKPAHRILKDCTCGFYAFKTIEEVVHQYGQGPSIYGEVWLWGKVIEGTKGYRAEYAEVKALYARHDEWEELHEVEYECECDDCGNEHRAKCWQGRYPDEKWLGEIAEAYGVEVVDSGWDENWIPEPVVDTKANIYARAMRAMNQQMATAIQQQIKLPNVFMTSLQKAEANLPTDVRLRRAGLLPPSGNDPARNQGATAADLWTPDRLVRAKHAIGRSMTDALIGQTVKIQLKG